MGAVSGPVCMTGLMGRLVKMNRKGLEGINTNFRQCSGICLGRLSKFSGYHIFWPRFAIHTSGIQGSATLHDHDRPIHVKLHTELRWPQIFHGATAPSGSGPPHCPRFTFTLRRTTLGRTPPDEWSVRRRDLYLTHILKRQISMPPAGFELTILAKERPQTHALDRAVTGIATSDIVTVNTSIQVASKMLGLISKVSYSHQNKELTPKICPHILDTPCIQTDLTYSMNVAYVCTNVMLISCWKCSWRSSNKI
jgi:hypothetical protein